MGTRRAILAVVFLLVMGLCFQAGLIFSADTGKTDKSAGSTIKTVVIKIPLPDLVVSALTLDKQCRVIVTLRNNGKGPVPEETFRRGQVRMMVGARQMSIPLIKADPKGILKALGSEIKVNSGLLLDKAALVQAEVDSTRQIAESDEGNNRRSATLTPHCNTIAVKGSGGLADQGIAAKSGGSTSSVTANMPPATGLAGSGQRSGITKPMTMTMSKRRLPPPGDRPTPIPLRLDQGILLLNPTENDIYYQGETIYILGRFTRNDVAAGNVTFNLMRVGVTQPVASTNVAVARATGVPIPLTTPVNIAAGDYYITATNTESGAYGESDLFQVAANSARIDFVSPERGAVLHPGTDMNLRYQFNRRVQPGTVTFQLYHAGAVVSTQTHEYRPGSAASRGQPIHTVHWDIPRNAPRGDYAILAIHPVATGISPLFSIQPRSFGDAGPGTPTAWSISLVTPGRMPVSWPRGSTKVIAWRIAGEYPSERRFLVQLKRGAETVLTIPADEAAWHAPSTSYSLNWTIPADLPPASDYRIQVMDRNGPTEGISERDFAITGPIEVLHGGGNRYIGNPTEIEWRIAPGSSVRRLRIVLVNYLRTGGGDEVVTIAERHPASAGKYTWTVGANRKVGDRWEYDHDRGSPIVGPTKVRVYDADDAAIYGEGMVFNIEPPDLRIWTSDSNCRGGKRVHWSSSNLQSSVRVEVAAIWRGCCIFANYSYIPIPLGRYERYHILSATNHPTGNFCWKFRDTNAGYYCFCLPGQDAYVVASVPGFQYVTMVQSSGTFDMTDSGCNNSDPPWEDIW